MGDIENVSLNFRVSAILDVMTRIQAYGIEVVVFVIGLFYRLWCFAKFL